MQKEKKGAVLLDLDGTLIDSRRDLATAVNLMRAELGGTPLPVDVVVGHVGDGVGQLVARSTADLQGDLDLDLAVATMLRHYHEHLVDETTLYPGTLEALEELREAGWSLAVVTNKPVAPAKILCDRLEISKWIEVVIGGDSCEHAKPHPEPLILALRRLGEPARGSWMVGDHRADLLAGRRTGLRRCFCRYGFGNPADEGWDVAVESPNELPVALDSWRADRRP